MAKDTVMSPLTIANIIDHRPGFNFFETGEYIATRQAEISFEAGKQDQSVLDQLNFDKERKVFWNKIAEAKKEGMRKVVEFLSLLFDDKGEIISHPTQEAWESFLKENGIDG